MAARAVRRRSSFVPRGKAQGLALRGFQITACGNVHRAFAVRILFERTLQYVNATALRIIACGNEYPRPLAQRHAGAHDHLTFVVAEHE